MTVCALIVDDQETWQLLFRREFRRIAAEVWVADNLQAALRIVHEQPALHVVTLDLNMPGSSVAEVIASIASIHSRHPHCAVIIVTGDSEEATRHASLAAQADAYMVKGAMLGNAEFFATILGALTQRTAGDPAMRARLQEIARTLAREAGHAANAAYIEERECSVGESAQSPSVTGH